MVGKKDLQISFAAQRSSSGFSSQLWEYSTNGSTWSSIGTLIGGTTAGTIRDSFANTGVLSLPTVTGLDGAATAYVKVTFTGATSSSGNNRLDNFRFMASAGSPTAPAITSFSPSSGSVGNTVTINGSNFGATPGVKFNGIAAASPIVNGAGTQMTVFVPSGATTGKITVEVGAETATSATDFTVIAPGTPTITLSTNTITGLSTLTGSPSTATNYTVTGTNLGATPITVTPSSALLEIGTNGTDFTNSLSLPAVGGVLSNNVFVRVAATNVVTNYTASISHVSGTASNSLAVSGAITAPVPGQTYFDMSSGDYSNSFSGWTNYATNWNGLAVDTTGTIPSATRITAASINIIAPSSSGGVQSTITSTNLQFLSTGSTVNTSSTGADLNLNFSGRNAGTISFAAAQVNNSTGDRVGTLQLYYSTDGSTWSELTGTGLPFTATNNVASSANISVNLPSALNGQSTVKLRFYYYNGPSNGTTGSRPKISIDDLLVTSVPASTAPSIISFSPASGLAGATVTINGFNFGATPGVKFNGTTATVTASSSTSITATVPSGATTGKITVEVAGEPTATSATDFTVLAPNTPIITLSTNTISGLSTLTGVASEATNYSVTGTNLGVTPITVTPDSGLLEIGTNGTDFTNTLSLPAVDGVLSNNVFVRVVATNVVTNYTASISHVSGTASNSLAVSGAITAPVPVLSVSTNTLSSFTTTTNTPSSAQTFTVTGSNLTTNVTVGAPTGFQVANDGSTWGTNTSLTPISGSVSNTVSVRLAATNVSGPFSGNVTVASTGATQRTVAVSGSVESPSVPGLVYWNFNTATPTSGTNGDYAAWTFGPLTQSNNNGTTTLFTSTSPSSGYTNPFNVVASGGTNAGAAARTGAFNADSNAFFEVQVVVPSNTTTSITNISFGSRSTGTGPAAYSIRSSADGFAADLATNTLTTNSTWAMNVAPVAIALSNGTNTIRIYGFNGSGSPSANTANWRIDDLTLALAAGVGPTPTPPTITSTNAFTGTVGVAFSNDVTATGDAPIGFSGTALPGGLSVASGGAITGTPTAAGPFNATLTATNAAGTTNQAVTFTIAKGAVSITTPPTASGLVQGQTLASSTLSGGSASVPGTFAWTDSSIIPPVGTTSYGVTFTPTDAANYDTATTSVSVTVVSAYQAGYSSWLTEFQLDPATTGLPEADPDGDGFNNRSEYAFGTNPTVPNGALLSTTATNSVFRASWNGPAQGVTYSVLSTTNLSTTPFAIDPATLSEDAGIMSFTNSATGNKFFRVRATSP
jgi:hypothetical protein